MLWYRNACWLGLLVIAIPFMVNQVRTGLYPQPEKPWQKIAPAPYQAVGQEAVEIHSSVPMVAGEKRRWSMVQADSVDRKSVV